MNKTNRNQIYRYREQTVVTSGKGRERDNTGVGEKRVVMAVYEIFCLKLLKVVKHYRT